MNPLRTLNINYPALADGECEALHPYLEEYETVQEESGRVVIFLEEE